MSNIYRTVIERLSHHTFNPNYTHWVSRNLNLNLLNRNLFVFLNFFFSLNWRLWQSSNGSIICWKSKCGNSSHTQIINHVFVYLSCNIVFSILFKAWSIYLYFIIKFLPQILWKKNIKFIDNTTFDIKIYLNYFISSLILFTY